MVPPTSKASRLPARSTSPNTAATNTRRMVRLLVMGNQRKLDSRIGKAVTLPVFDDLFLDFLRPQVAEGTPPRDLIGRQIIRRETIVDYLGAPCQVSLFRAQVGDQWQYAFSRKQACVTLRVAACGEGPDDFFQVG